MRKFFKFKMCIARYSQLNFIQIIFKNPKIWGKFNNNIILLVLVKTTFKYFDRGIVHLQWVYTNKSPLDFARSWETDAGNPKESKVC